MGGKVSSACSDSSQERRLQLVINNFFHDRCDSIPRMRACTAQLSLKLSNDTDYFRSVYNFTFDFAKTEAGQRSIRESISRYRVV
jgi:hypothetical protein